MADGKTCTECKGWGFTNEASAAGDNRNVVFDPPEMQICECSRGRARGGRAS